MHALTKEIYYILTKEIFTIKLVFKDFQFIFSLYSGLLYYDFVEFFFLQKI